MNREILKYIINKFWALPFIILPIFLIEGCGGSPISEWKKVCLEGNSSCIHEWYWGGGGAAGWTDIRVFLSENASHEIDFSKEKPIAIYYRGCSSLSLSKQKTAVIKLCGLDLKTFNLDSKVDYEVVVPKSCDLTVLKKLYSYDNYAVFKKTCASML